MPNQVDLSVFIKRHPDGSTSLDFAVDGITCAACIGDIEGALKNVPGITRARVNYTNHRLNVEWADPSFDPAQVIDALARINYHAYPFSYDETEEREARRARWLLRCLAVAGFAAMNIMLLSVSVWAGNASDMTPATRDFFHWLSALIVLPAAAFAGQPFFQSAIGAIRARSLNMDVPISIGILLALTMSVVETARHAREAYFDSAIMLIFFLLIGRYFDQAMRRKTRAVATNLAALRAPVATKLGADGVEEIMPVSALAAGERVLVKPGAKIPVDGIVLSGHSKIDAAIITGETKHQNVSPGALVYAGSVNFDGLLTLEVKAAGRGTLLDEIEHMIEKATEAKSRYLRLADRASRLYAPVVHATAAGTLIFWLVTGASFHDAAIAAISVLIITCPCALALAIPAVQVVAAGALFRSGILLNSGDAIERLAKTDTVLFDKTGTLTLPEPVLVDAATYDPATLEEAARLATASRHPLARALALHAKGAASLDMATEIRGAGVEAIVNGQQARLGSPSFCNLEDEAERALAHEPCASALAYRCGERQAIFLMRQMLRPDARQAIDALRAQGMTLMIASGDHAEAVRDVAEELGIAEWKASLKPSEKIALLEELKAAGKKVLMIGDGLNDAPALAAAFASLSPISATDLAQASADAVFLGERLMPVALAVATTRKAHRLMRQNLAFSVLYNAVAVPLAMAGLLTPLIAACAMSGSSILVTANALRANTGGRPQPDSQRRVCEKTLPTMMEARS
ncbi:MAG: heavy metal translocating P-type ATPase [Methylovirgula sp.]|jgi:Cu2+-exporting ATPase